MIKENKRRIEEREDIRKNIISYETKQIDLVDRIITILYKLNGAVLYYYNQSQSTKKEFREDIQKQAIQTLFWKCISQIESILILIENGKYPEAYSILRNLFENSMFLLYIVECPFEADRWLNWASMDFKEIKKYRKMNKFEEFKSFLKENSYNELLKLIEPNNFKKYRDFRIGFIREKAFKNNPSVKGSDFEEVYHELCAFVHPSIRGLHHIDKVNHIQFSDIVADISYIARNTADIFIGFFQGKINKFLIEQYEDLKIEIKKNEDELSRINKPSAS